MACPQPAFAGYSGGAVWRSFLWPLHLWLASRGGRHVAFRRPCSMVASVPLCFAGGRHIGVPIVAPRRAPDFAPNAKLAPRRGKQPADGATGVIEGLAPSFAPPLVWRLEANFEGDT